MAIRFSLQLKVERDDRPTVDLPVMTSDELGRETLEIPGVIGHALLVALQSFGMSSPQRLTKSRYETVREFGERVHRSLIEAEAAFQITDHLRLGDDFSITPLPPQGT